MSSEEHHGLPFRRKIRIEVFLLRAAMRMAIVTLLFAACTTTMHFRVIDKGAYGADAVKAETSKPSIAVAADSGAYERLFASVVGRPGAPKVDFAKESAVFLMLGTRPTGGWSIEPLEAAEEGGVTTIKTKVNAPSGGSIVTMAFTAPYAIVAVDRKVTAVRWLDENGNVLAETK
jgi:hypothetical protein